MDCLKELEGVGQVTGMGCVKFRQLPVLLPYFFNVFLTISYLDVESSEGNINLLLTEREGRTGEYWPKVVAVRTERSEVRTKTTEGQYSPVRSRASEVSKWFIIWHHFSYETTLPVVHSSQFPARCQGKKPAILTGFRISLMIVAVDRQKLAWLLNENCSASIICVSFSSSCTTQESFI